MEPERCVALWHYERIKLAEPDRAELLRSASKWLDLSTVISDAVRTSLQGGTIRFGFDESGREVNDLRAILQFPVGEQVFDWFFNSQTGYRAQFRKSARYGNEQNVALIEALRRELEPYKSTSIRGRRLSTEFNDLGPMTVLGSDVLASLSPPLSKVWFCAKLIGLDGGVKELTVYTSTPDLAFASGSDAWRSIYANGPNAWLDVKGAFVGPAGFYQIKDPMLRAEGLHCRGTA